MKKQTKREQVEDAITSLYIVEAFLKSERIEIMKRASDTQYNKEHGIEFEKYNLMRDTDGKKCFIGTDLQYLSNAIKQLERIVDSK